jgi:hypothetical protein
MVEAKKLQTSDSRASEEKMATFSFTLKFNNNLLTHS